MGRKSAFSLVELLVVMVILIAIGSFVTMRYVGSGRGPHGERQSTPMSRAHDTECVANIRSVRQAIEVAKVGAEENKFPASLTELKLPSEITRCAVGKVDYAYDSHTGEVKCPYPGHEKY